MDEKEFDYLNVIPLVDVMLVLLTIVLTTSTFIATGGIQVELPKAASTETAAPLTPRTLTIGQEGRIWVEADEVSLATLADALAATGRDTPLLSDGSAKGRTVRLRIMSQILYTAAVCRRRSARKSERTDVDGKIKLYAVAVNVPAMMFFHPYPREENPENKPPSRPASTVRRSAATEGETAVPSYKAASRPDGYLPFRPA